MRKLTQFRLKKLLSYDPETGVFVRIKTVSNNAKEGDVAGTLLDGYIRIAIDGVIYPAHHLAWLYVHGVWPVLLDHRDTDRSNNRILNLREASTAENAHNQHKPNGSTKSGLRGVSWDRVAKKWQARIKKDGKSRNLGTFLDKNDAHAAYLKAKKELHPFAFK